MFNNVGSKIKTISRTLCIILIILIAIFTIIIMANGGLISEEGTLTTLNNWHSYRHRDFYIPSGMVLIYGIALCISVYFTFLLTYGFGQLIENTSSKNEEPGKSEPEQTINEKTITDRFGQFKEQLREILVPDTNSNLKNTTAQEESEKRTKQLRRIKSLWLIG